MPGWLQNNLESHQLLGGVLGVLQPDLFDIGYACYEEIINNSDDIVKNVSHLAPALECWSIPVNAMSIISNRQTGLHRDILGRYQCLDLLLALGNYENGRFEVPGLGLRLAYDAGTVIAMCARPGTAPCYA